MKNGEMPAWFNCTVLKHAEINEIYEVQYDDDQACHLIYIRDGLHRF